MLVAFSGLPGSGKSWVARPVAASLGLAHLELDRIEAPILRRVDGDRLGWGGYEILTALAEDNLAIGVSLVLDAVTWTNELRARWRDLAVRHGARFRPIEVVCPDRAIHRARVEGRDAGEAGKNVWRRVEGSFRLYEPWTLERLVLDSTRPLEDLTRETVAYVRSP